jgi:hypothetical protein
MCNDCRARVNLDAIKLDFSEVGIRIRASSPEIRPGQSAIPNRLKRQRDSSITEINVSIRSRFCYERASKEMSIAHISACIFVKLPR